MPIYQLIHCYLFELLSEGCWVPSILWISKCQWTSSWPRMLFQQVKHDDADLHGAAGQEDALPPYVTNSVAEKWCWWMIHDTTTTINHDHLSAISVLDAMMVPSFVISLVFTSGLRTFTVHNSTYIGSIGSVGMCPCLQYFSHLYIYMLLDMFND